MASSVFGRKIRLSNKLRAYLIVALITIALGIAYVFLLRFEDREAVTDLALIQQKDPVHYLESVRQHKGFAAYLEAVTEKYGFDTYQNNVPNFLIGRWALFDQPKRVGYQFVAEDCSNFVAIEDGEIKVVGNSPAQYAAKYRISGSAVEALLADGKVVPIELVSFGMDLHHIVLTLPGRTAPQYGYLCK